MHATARAAPARRQLRSLSTRASCVSDLPAASPHALARGLDALMKHSNSNVVTHSRTSTAKFFFQELWSFESFRNFQEFSQNFRNLRNPASAW